MNIDLTEEELAFRDEVRQFFTSNYPEDIRRKRDNGITLTRDDMIRWQNSYANGIFIVVVSINGFL